MLQIHLPGNVLESSAAQILVEDALFAAFGMEVTFKGVGVSQVKTSTALFIECIDADIDEEQIQQAILVEVEEDRAGGVPDVSEARLFCDVAEPPVSEVFEQRVAHPDGGDEEVRQAIVVDVRKGSGYANLPGHADAGCGGDILEGSVSPVSQKLVTPQMVAKLKDQQA